MLESITPDIIGRELRKAQVVSSTRSLHLEPIPRNPERNDYLTRANFRAFSGTRTICNLVIGPNLADLWKRSRGFAEACPEIACRPLFWHRTGRWDLIGFEHFDGRHLEALALDGKIGTEEVVRHVDRVVAALRRTQRTSRIQAAAQEIDALFARVTALPIFGGLDHQFLREVVFPLVRSGALSGPYHTRWTNGDLIPRNVLADGNGNVRLIDYEFAKRTHFFQEDWWRWRSFSTLPPEARDLPALRDSLPSGHWLEAFFILHQLVLAFATNCTHLVVVDSREALERLVALAAMAHSGFRASVFLRPLAAPSPVLAAAPAPGRVFAQLYWNTDGTYTEESSQRSEYSVNQDTLIRFVIRGLRGCLHLRLDPADAVGFVQISGLRVRTLGRNAPLFALSDGAAWATCGGGWCCEGSRNVVVDQLAAAAGEDRRAASQARSVLLDDAPAEGHLTRSCCSQAVARILACRAAG